jgi:hypothetical protein
VQLVPKPVEGFGVRGWLKPGTSNDLMEVWEFR